MTHRKAAPEPNSGLSWAELRDACAAIKPGAVSVFMKYGSPFFLAAGFGSWSGQWYLQQASNKTYNASGLVKAINTQLPQKKLGVAARALQGYRLLITGIARGRDYPQRPEYVKEDDLVLELSPQAPASKTVIVNPKANELRHGLGPPKAGTD